MPTCRRCSVTFPNYIKVNGKPFSLSARKYCIECSPIGNKCFCGPAPSGLTKEQIKASRAALVGEKRRKRKQFAVTLLGGKCQECGYDKCIAAMDFHHVDGSTKENTVSGMFDSSEDKFINEAKKCRLLCCRCHAELHDRLNRQARENKSMVGLA